MKYEPDRIAKVHVPQQDLMDHPDEVMELLTTGLIVGCRFEPWSMSYRYVLLHRDFAKVPFTKIPHLKIVAETYIGGKPVYAFREA